MTTQLKGILVTIIVLKKANKSYTVNNLVSYTRNASENLKNVIKKRIVDTVRRRNKRNYENDQVEKYNKTFKKNAVKKYINI